VTSFDSVFFGGERDLTFFPAFSDFLRSESDLSGSIIIVIIIMTNDDGENNVNTCIPYDFNSRTFTF